MTQFLLIISILFASTVSLAQNIDKRTPLEVYQGETFFFLTSCGFKFNIAQLKASISEPQDESSNYSDCIYNSKPKAKEALDRALKTVKKPRAQEALKSYHVAFVTALEGIRPGVGERKISYEQRQQALKDRLSEAWARFEVEQ